MSLTPDYERDGIRLYCGDCLEILPQLEAIDAVVTDPPYGVGIKYHSYADTRAALSALIAAFMPLATRVATRVLVFCGVKNVWLYPEPTWVLNWTDPSGQGCCPWGFASWSPILAYGKDPFLQRRLGSRSDTIVKRFLRDKSIRHPCPKPPGIMGWLLWRATFPVELVCDPFMGSGTTGVACIRTGRRFVGIEREPKYFDIAVKRIDAELSQGRLDFTPAPVTTQPALAFE